ncbi:MAG TPA: SIMPL domain-containing protein [Thermoanaerobaculia bacterium]|nr:SIMPL domain-containing protein [Thermoanaerobaculia bacterium]
MHRLLPALLLALPLLADEPPRRTISTSGEATVRVAPDQAVLNLGVDSFAPTLAEATRINADVGARLLAAVKAAGVEQKDIAIDTLRLNIRYRDSNRPSKGIEGYDAERSYAITVRRIDRVEETLRAALDAGANSIAGVQFRTTEARKHRDEARRMAVRAASEKAQLLANELGAKVGSPMTITEGSQNWYGYYGRQNANLMAQNAYQEPSGGGAPPDEAIAPGQLSVTASVSVVFDLLPGVK